VLKGGYLVAIGTRFLYKLHQGLYIVADGVFRHMLRLSRGLIKSELEAANHIRTK